MSKNDKNKNKKRKIMSKNKIKKNERNGFFFLTHMIEW